MVLVLISPNGCVLLTAAGEEQIRDSNGISELSPKQLILPSCFRVSLEIPLLSLEQMRNVRTLVTLLSRRRRKTIKTNFP